MKGGLFLAMGCIACASARWTSTTCAGIGARCRGPPSPGSWAAWPDRRAGHGRLRQQVVPDPRRAGSRLVARGARWSCSARCWRWSTSGASSRWPTSAPPGRCRAREAPLSMLIPTWLLIGASLCSASGPRWSAGAARGAEALLGSGRERGRRSSPGAGAAAAGRRADLACSAAAQRARGRNADRRVARCSPCRSRSRPRCSAGGAPDGRAVRADAPASRWPSRSSRWGMLFALVASGLWIVTSLYSIGYMRAHDESNQTRFYACFAVAIFGADRRRLRAQPAHAVRVLRGADAVDLPAGHAPRRREGAARRPGLPRRPADDLDRDVAAGHDLDLVAPARWTSGRAGSSPARPTPTRCSACCWRCSPSAPARPR